MTHNFVFEGVEPPENIRRLIRDRVERLGKETKGLAEGAGSLLRVNIEPNEAYSVQ